MNFSSYQLTLAESSLLQRGLTFCPTPPQLDQIQLTADFHDFYRRLRLRDFFADKPSSSHEESALQTTNLARKSTWQPPKNLRSAEVETFVNVFHSSVRESLRSIALRNARRNLPTEEFEALHNLAKNTNIVIRPADKCSAVVIQDVSTYKAEAQRQLSDRAFYELADNNLTAQHNGLVRDAVNSMLELEGSTKKKKKKRWPTSLKRRSVHPTFTPCRKFTRA